MKEIRLIDKGVELQELRCLHCHELIDAGLILRKTRFSELVVMPLCFECGFPVLFETLSKYYMWDCYDDKWKIEEGPVYSDEIKTLEDILKGDKSATKEIQGMLVEAIDSVISDSIREGVYSDLYDELGPDVEYDLRCELRPQVIVDLKRDEDVRDAAVDELMRHDSDVYNQAMDALLSDDLVVKEAIRRLHNDIGFVTGVQENVRKEYIKSLIKLKRDNDKFFESEVKIMAIMEIKAELREEMARRRKERTEIFLKRMEERRKNVSRFSIT